MGQSPLEVLAANHNGGSRLLRTIFCTVLLSIVNKLCTLGKAHFISLMKICHYQKKESGNFESGKQERGKKNSNFKAVLTCEHSDKSFPQGGLVVDLEDFLFERGISNKGGACSSPSAGEDRSEKRPQVFFNINSKRGKIIITS